jgi:hypothetical protein
VKKGFFGAKSSKIGLTKTYLAAKVANFWNWFLFFVI